MSFTFRNNGQEYTFHARQIQEHVGQTLFRGMMDVGGYDEKSLVSIEGRKMYAYVEDILLEDIYKLN